jgi:hypothetical protein
VRQGVPLPVERIVVVLVIEKAAVFVHDWFD